jgi:RimJ/RimL family protein N-acetyltransferase
MPNSNAMNLALVNVGRCADRNPARARPSRTRVAPPIRATQMLLPRRRARNPLESPVPPAPFGSSTARRLSWGARSESLTVDCMAATPKPRPNAPPCRLRAFEPIWADHIAGWARDPQEAYWLAPKTRPPLTAASLLRWIEPGHAPYLLWEEGGAAPVAYGEVNRLLRARRQYWLGHLVVDPERRGRGYGVALVRGLLQEAFEQRGAVRVTLVVFAENVPALACYRRAGMHEDGWEWHNFPLYGKRECLLRFAAERLA